MSRALRIAFVVAVGVTMAGCETTHSLPYKASTANVVTIQQKIRAKNKKVALDGIVMAPGVEESPMCRLAGPVKVAPGKSIPEYIRDALQEELFMAQVYEADASVWLKGVVEELSFSSVAPANWTIKMKIHSSNGVSYRVDTKYHFNTSWSAASACRNVADAFGPAVQQLLKEVVSHADFPRLVE